MRLRRGKHGLLQAAALRILVEAKAGGDHDGGLRAQCAELGDQTLAPSRAACR